LDDAGNGQRWSGAGKAPQRVELVRGFVVLGPFATFMIVTWPPLESPIDSRYQASGSE
jgi:hypothetical protein